LPKVCCISAVKGGVGKTFISINIAHKLKEMGNKVGLIDCDWDNPNFAQFTGVEGEIKISKDLRFEPYDWNGVQVFSMSLIAGRERSVSMTGDRYWQMMDDVARRSMWDCDYFVVDLPSGSGDVFKAAINVFAENLVGDIIIIQPSMIDAARRVLNLHKYFEIPVLGLIENMSYFVCPYHKSPKVFHIFGESIIEELGKEYNVDVLGKIPFIPDLPEKIKSGNPILEGEYAQPIENACKKIVETPVQKPGFLERFKTRVLEAIKTELEKVMAFLIVAINKEIDITGIKTATGLTEERPFLLRITDESKTKEITSLALRVKGNKLVVLKNPGKLDFEIITDFRTIARMIMGKKKVGDQYVDFDPMSAWLNGDVVTAGYGYAPRAVHVLREIFGNEQFMKQVRERYGPLLERWL